MIQRLFICFLIFFSVSIIPLSAGRADRAAYRKVLHYFNIHNYSKARSRAYRFLRRYKRSRYVADIRFILAKTETSPAKAVKKLLILIKYYKYYKKNDQVYLSICEIHHLRGNWKQLLYAAGKAGRSYPKSTYYFDFMRYKAIALMKLGKYSKAKSLCLRLLEQNHNYNYLAAVLLRYALIIHKTTGFSRSYIYKLRELTLGFYESNYIPSILYLLGEFYEHHKDYNKAYTAYTDTTRYFPYSPEARKADIRIKLLKKFNPRKEKYIPEKKIIDTFDNIYLDNHIVRTDKKQKAYYALSVGPFSSKERTNSIKRIVAKFDGIHIAYVNKHYYIFVGHYKTSTSAYRVKIRLAEEYGINATVVRITNKKGKSYIYRE